MFPKKALGTACGSSRVHAKNSIRKVPVGLKQYSNINIEQNNYAAGDKMNTSATIDMIQENTEITQ